MHGKHCPDDPGMTGYKTVNQSKKGLRAWQYITIAQIEKTYLCEGQWGGADAMRGS